MPAILGIDVGTKTLGLAVSDETETIAFTLRTIVRKNMTHDLKEILSEIEERSGREVVVGLPLNLDGTRGVMSDEADRIVQLLTVKGYVVHRWDERMSTVSAERALLEADVSRKRRKDVIDKMAAALVLQAFLDQRKQAAL